MTLSPAQRQTLTWTALAALAALALWLLAPVLTPFVVASVLAYALHPLVEQLAVRRWPRVLAVLLVEGLALLALMSVLLLILPVMARELPLLKAQVPVLLDGLNATVNPLLARAGFDITLDVASIKAWLAQLMDANMQEWLSAALASARIAESAPCIQSRPRPTRKKPSSGEGRLRLGRSTSWAGRRARMASRSGHLVSKPRPRGRTLRSPGRAQVAARTASSSIGKRSSRPSVLPMRSLRARLSSGSQPRCQTCKISLIGSATTSW
jgi:hypothetical protein